jgi:hypothetical protein
MKHIGTTITSVSQKTVVALEVQQHHTYRKLTPTKGTKALYSAVYTLALACFMCAPVAHAQQTAGDSADTAGATFDKYRSLAGKIGLCVAAFCGVGAALKMKQRSNEGEASQVKVGTILGLIGSAVLAAAFGAIMLRVGASVGLQSSDYGTVPGN